MIRLVVTVSGVPETNKKLAGITTSLKDFSSEFKTIAKYLKTFFQVNVFETQGDAFGEPWTALSPKYEFEKRVKYAGRGILERTGTMRKSFDYQYGKSFARVFNDVSYASYHQTGTRKMPQRMLVKIDEPRQNEIIRIIKGGVYNKLRKELK